MKNLIAAAVLVLLFSSTALAGWPYAVPVVTYSPVVAQSYYPMAPVYPVAPTYAYQPHVVSYTPTVAYMPPVVSNHVVYSPGVYAPMPMVVRPRVFFYGQPVRNVFRAVLP